jgi:hypothetical protein
VALVALFLITVAVLFLETKDKTEFWVRLPAVLWPLVAIVGIVALFLIARQAISSGNNVTILRKVTENMHGRVVITRVRERAPRKKSGPSRDLGNHAALAKAGSTSAIRSNRCPNPAPSVPL